MQGVKGEAVVWLPRTLDNTADGVLSAFPKGKQNEDLKEKTSFTDTRNTKLHIKLTVYCNLNVIQCFFILFTLN